MSASIRETVDLGRYPIDRLDSDEGRALVELMQAALTENGACELPGFRTPDAINDAVTLARANRDDAFRMDQEHDIEFTDAEPTALAEHDIHRYRVRTAKGGTAYLSQGR